MRCLAVLKKQIRISVDSPRPRTLTIKRNVWDNLYGYMGKKAVYDIGSGSMDAAEIAYEHQRVGDNVKILDYEVGEYFKAYSKNGGKWERSAWDKQHSL